MKRCGSAIRLSARKELTGGGDAVKTTACERWAGRAGPRLAAALVALLIASLCATAASAEAIEVEALPLAFNPEAPLQRGVGRLVHRGGLELRAGVDGFGGFSAMRVNADGTRLLALSDVGTWLSLTLDYDGAGRLVGVSRAHLAAMARPEGGGRFDPEGLVVEADGALIVSTERRHRLLRYADPAARDDPFARDADALARLEPVTLPAPEDFAAMESNAGLETLLRLGDGHLLAIEEGREAEGEALSRAWLIGPDGASAAVTLRRTANFRPTDAALLPDGAVLLLERRYTEIGGVAARLRLIEAGAIRPGAVLDGATVATLIPPVTVDNMEALAVYERGGETRLLLMSDDNFNAGLQRTLLLQFALQPMARKQ